MSTLADRVTELATALKAAGVRTTSDPRSIAPPVVLLTPPEITLDGNCGGTATFDAWVIVPPPANLDAWKKADELAAKIAAVIPLEVVRPASYGPDPDGGLPAMQCTWTEYLNWP